MMLLIFLAFFTVTADVRINFQSIDVEVPQGYVADFGEIYGDRGNGYNYGWNCDFSEAGDNNGCRNRDTSMSELMNSGVIPDRQGYCADSMWEFELSNGDYDVTTYHCDTMYAGDYTNCWVEGVHFDVPSSDICSGWDGRSANNVVTVADGKLTFDGNFWESCSYISYMVIKEPDGCADNPCDAATQTCLDVPIPGSGYECVDICGNGVLDDDEECDDGNGLNYDGCSSACLIEDYFECEDMFSFSSTVRTFDDSVAYCESIGMQITSVHSDVELGIIDDLSSGAKLYIGALSDGDANWFWLDGTGWGYLPQVTDGLAGITEIVVAQFMDTNGDVTWNDWGTGTVLFPTVCRNVIDGVTILGSYADWDGSVDSYGIMTTFVDLDRQNVAAMAANGGDGGELTDDVYLGMVVTLSSPDVFPTTFEYTVENNEGGFALTLTPWDGVWKAGDNEVLMNVNQYATYYGDAPWSQMPRLQLYASLGADESTDETISLTGVRLYRKMCSAVTCDAEQRVIDYVCSPCAAGTSDSFGGHLVSWGNSDCPAIICDEDEYVSNNACETCASGYERPAGDDASGEDTSCTPMPCDATALLSGADSDGDCGSDLASGSTCTQEPQDGYTCSASSCLEGSLTVGVCEDINECDEGACDAVATCDNTDGSYDCTCPPGYDGDGESCEAILCSDNEYVSSHECVPCATGSWRGAGDDASGDDTSCSSECGTNQYVMSNGCIACELGTTNEAGDDATGADTECDVTICGENQYVFSHACIDCVDGSTATAGGDASGNNTACEVTLCAEDEYVSSNVCTACAAGSTNAAGDDATGSDTTCTATYCAVDEYVKDHACLRCAEGSNNAEGDVATGDDTLCDVAVTSSSSARAGSEANAASSPESAQDILGSITSSPTGIATTTIVIMVLIALVLYLAWKNRQSKRKAAMIAPVQAIHRLGNPVSDDSAEDEDDVSSVEMLA